MSFTRRIENECVCMSESMNNTDESEKEGLCCGFKIPINVTKEIHAHTPLSMRVAIVIHLSPH